LVYTTFIDDGDSSLGMAHIIKFTQKIHILSARELLLQVTSWLIGNIDGFFYLTNFEVVSAKWPVQDLSSRK
jgi:hypothetical protein